MNRQKHDTKVPRIQVTGENTKTVIKFERIRRGAYVSQDRRFFLEKHERSWRLLEEDKLVGYKPTALRTARTTSPVWLRSDSSRAALAWARSRLYR